MMIDQKVHTKLIVSGALFPEIRRRLKEVNCNSRVLFPGIDGYGRYLKTTPSKTRSRVTKVRLPYALPMIYKVK